MLLSQLIGWLACDQKKLYIYFIHLKDQTHSNSSRLTQSSSLFVVLRELSKLAVLNGLGQFEHSRALLGNMRQYGAVLGSFKQFCSLFGSFWAVIHNLGQSCAA